jgi:hypothetical protein
MKNKFYNLHTKPSRPNCKGLEELKVKIEKTFGNVQKAAEEEHA